MSSKTIRRAIATFGRRFKLKKKALLLPVQSLVMARHLLPLADIAAEMGIRTFFTTAPNLSNNQAEFRLVRELFADKASYIGLLPAHFYRWNLVVLADHGCFHTLAWNGSPLAHIGHGNPSKSTKRFPTIPWEYSNIPRLPDGSIVYRELIESAEGVRTAIAELDPALGQKIRVLGRLLDDKALEARNAAQSSLRTGKPMLLMVSTLGPDSAFSSYWDALADVGKDLLDHYRVVICPHPNEYDNWLAKATTNNLEVIPRGVATEEFLATASAVVCDFSSVCQKAALMGIPLVFFRQDNAPVWPQGATARLYRLAPKWQPGECLRTLLQHSSRDLGDMQAVAHEWVNSRPGSAAIAYSLWLKPYFPS